MIKNRLIRRYKVDPYGTEEIVSHDSLSVAPILDIDYGDEVQQGTQFVFRLTKGVLDTNIIDPAVINRIKGDTVKFNQLVDNSDLQNWTKLFSTVTFTEDSIIITNTEDGSGRIYDVGKIIAGHTYYISMTAKGVGYITIAKNGANNGNSTVNVDGAVFTSVAAICSATENSNAIKISLLSKSLTGDSFEVKRSVKVIDLTDIFGAGNEPSTVGDFEAWLAQKLGLKECYPYNSSSLISVKMTGIKTAGINPAWESITNIPVTALKGRLNGTGSSVVVFPDGMKSAGDVRDEIKIENGVLKGFKLVDTREYQSGDVDSSTMTTDGANYTNYALSTPEEYIIDDIDVSKIMLGTTEVKKVYLGNQLMFEP